MNQLRQIHLTHHGRHHMTILQVEVIIRTIEVCRHHGNIVRAILQVIALAHLQSCNLRDSILFVGIL